MEAYPDAYAVAETSLSSLSNSLGSRAVGSLERLFASLRSRSVPVHIRVAEGEAQPLIESVRRLARGP